MHVHSEDVEIAESVGPSLHSYRIAGFERRFGPGQKLLRRFLSAPGLLDLDHVKRSLVVVFWVVELRDALLQALQFYLDSGKSINQCAPALPPMR